jgi:glycosyltransferase involved in cell wall biosynthesis
VGHRDDPLNVISQLDTLVINSRSEAFVMVAIEAMACGTPVIATNVGGTREMIQHRFNGWLTDFGNETQLTEALVTLYDNDLQRRLFVRRSRAVVEQRLNARRFISEFQSALMAEPLSAEIPTPEPISLSV